MSTQEAITTIKILTLVDSPFQPRTVYDPASLEELAATMRPPHGRVHQPIVVRMVDGKAEIVFGHRRSRGAALAGLESVPAIVREMTDEEVKLAQIVENLQREGVNAVEEADALHRLREEHGATIETLMQQSGKSRSYVYGRLRLAMAHPAVRNAVVEGTTGAETAQEVARLPFPMQHKALAAVCHMSSRAAKLELEHRFQFKLASAPFDTLSLKLLPSAGACDACPKRSDREPVLLAEVGENVCMDGDCYGKKATLAREAAEKAAKKAEAKQSTAAKVEPAPAAWPFPRHQPVQAQIDGVDPAEEDEDGTPKPETVYERTPEEKAVMDADQWGKIRHAMLHATLTRPRTTDDMRYLLARELDLGDSHFDDAEEVLGWSLPQGSGSAARKAKLQDLTADQLGALLMMTVILTGPFSHYSGKSQAQMRIDMAEHFGVDVLTGLQASAQPASTPPPAARAPKKAKAAAGAKTAKAKATPAKGKSKSKSEEQKDDAGVAGGSTGQVDAFEEAGA